MEDDLSLAYEGFIKSSLGKHFLNWLSSQRAHEIDRAEKSLDPYEAFALTRTSNAFTMVVTHLESMAQGHKVKKKIVNPRQSGT